MRSDHPGPASPLRKHFHLITDRRRLDMEAIVQATQIHLALTRDLSQRRQRRQSPDEPRASGSPDSWEREATSAQSM